MALRRRIGAIGAQAIEGACADALYMAVEHGAGSAGQGDADDFHLALDVE